jgi:hypothetical protein
MEYPLLPVFETSFAVFVAVFLIVFLFRQQRWFRFLLAASFGPDPGHGGEHCPLHLLALLQNKGKPFLSKTGFTLILEKKFLPVALELLSQGSEGIYRGPWSSVFELSWTLQM